jgi:hypothetical protein
MLERHKVWPLSWSFGLAEEVFELIVRSNPEPNYTVTVSLADSSVLLADTDGPKIFIAA